MLRSRQLAGRPGSQLSHQVLWRSAVLRELHQTVNCLGSQGAPPCLSPGAGSKLKRATIAAKLRTNLDTTRNYASEN